MNNRNQPQLTPDQIQMFTTAMKSAKDIKCSCGGEIFNQGLRIKVLSKLLIGAEEDEYLRIPAPYCIKCLKELVPDQEPPKEEIVLDFKR